MASGGCAASHLHLWCHWVPIYTMEAGMQGKGTGGRDWGAALQNAEDGANRVQVEQKHIWSWGTLGEAGQRASHCVQRGGQKGTGHDIYILHYIFVYILHILSEAAWPQHTSPATKHPWNSSGNAPFLPRLTYIWVLMIICYVLSLWPRSMWDLKCLSLDEELLGFTSPQDYSLSRTRFAVHTWCSLLHRHYTCITCRMRVGKETLKFQRCLSCLYSFSPDPLLTVHFHRHAHNFLPQGTLYPLHAGTFTCRMNLSCAAKGKLLGKLWPEKLRK